jgi:hypothetical protein
MQRATRSVILCCLLAPSAACDQVKGLLSDAEPEATKAEAKAAADAPSASAATAPTKSEAPAVTVVAAPAPEPSPTPAATPDAPEAAPGSAPTPDAAVAAAAAGQPCIVGRWDAIEYTAAVRHAIAKDPQLRSMKKTSSGGHITYVIDPPTGTSGAIRATADHLQYGFSGKVEGFPVRLDLDVNGETEATYELPGEGRIVVGKPKSNTMKVKANVKIEGLGSTRKSSKVDLDFDGSFVYACSGDKLEVWRGVRSEDAMVFTRNTSG